MKKLLSLIMAMILLFSLSACGDRGNESSQPNNSQNNSQSNSSQSNSSTEIEKVEYVPITYKEPYDPERQTLTKAEYEKLYNAITHNDTAFPGTECYYRTIKDLVDLRQYSKIGMMLDMLYNKFGNRGFTEAELRNAIGDKVEVTEYDLYFIKTRCNIDIKWHSDTNTYEFRGEYKAEYAGESSTGNNRLYNSYAGYRDMGENKYEFYFVMTIPEKLITAMFGEHSESNLTDDEKQQLRAMEATAVDGVVTYDGKKYYAVTSGSEANGNDPPTTIYWHLAEKDEYKIYTMELKDGAVKLVDITTESSYFTDNLSYTYPPLPTTFSKIPTE